MKLEELQALERRYLMQTYRRAPVEFVRGEGAAALGRRGQGVPRLPRRDLGLLGRPLPPRRGRGGARAGGHADARLQPLLHRADGAARRAALGVEPRRAGSSSPTRGPRRTSARSRSPASTPTGGASRAPRSSASSATSTAGPTAPSRRRRNWPRTRRWGRCCPASARCPSTTPARCATPSTRSTAAVMIEPIQGESGIYPLARGDAARRAAGLRRSRRAADLRRDPDRDGADRLALGLPADARPARPADQRQGARRRPAGRRLRDRRGAAATCSSPATTARPSPAARSVSAAALAVLDLVDDPALLRRVRELGAELRESLLAIDGVVEVRGRGLMLGVGLGRAASTPRRSAPTCSSAA